MTPHYENLRANWQNKTHLLWRLPASVPFDFAELSTSSFTV